MPTFTYEATTPDGISVASQIEAENISAALDLIRRAGMFPTRVGEKANAARPIGHSQATESAGRKGYRWDSDRAMVAHVNECGYPDCKGMNPEFARFCSRCGRENIADEVLSKNARGTITVFAVAVAFAVAILLLFFMLTAAG